MSIESIPASAGITKREDHRKVPISLRQEQLIRKFYWFDGVFIMIISSLEIPHRRCDDIIVVFAWRLQHNPFSAFLNELDKDIFPVGRDF